MVKLPMSWYNKVVSITGGLSVIEFGCNDSYMAPRQGLEGINAEFLRFIACCTHRNLNTVAKS
jgi:hypothetical protein